MIGSLNPLEKKATIVGAGISGLLIAYFLKKQGFKVEVLEASSRAGGLIRTKETSFGPAETAAHSLLVTPAVESLFHELGIELLPVRPDSRARFIYRDGKMRRMPLKFRELIYTIYRLFSKPRPGFNPHTGTLAEWCEAYLGSPAKDFLLGPFVTGVYACGLDELNARLAFPSLVPLEPGISLFRHLRKNRKGKKPKSRMMVPSQGMEAVVKALTDSLHSELKLNRHVDHLPESSNLILSVPSAALSKLISKADSQSAQKLLQIRYAPLVTVTCFYPETRFVKPPKGVGVLIPRGQGYRVLGVLFNSSAFDKRATPRSVSLTVMLGGTRDPTAIELDDEEIRNLIHSELVRLIQVTGKPQEMSITRWNRAIPVYSNELKNARESLSAGFCLRPGQIVFNNFSDEVSIRGMIESLSQL